MYKDIGIPVNLASVQSLEPGVNFVRINSDTASAYQALNDLARIEGVRVVSFQEVTQPASTTMTGTATTSDGGLIYEIEMAVPPMEPFPIDLIVHLIYQP